MGVSGWAYPPWRGAFYPKGLRQADELAYAAAHVTSIEVNGSFYSLQPPANWRRWRDATPDGFVLAVKGPRFVTHIKRLREIETPLANFFASGCSNSATSSARCSGSFRRPSHSTPSCSTSSSAGFPDRERMPRRSRPAMTSGCRDAPHSH